MPALTATKPSEVGSDRLTVTRPDLLSNGTDATFRDFIHDFLAFSARVAQIRAGFGEAIGLTGIAYTVLMSIGHLQGDEGVGVARLAGHVHLSGAFVTIEVAKLVTAGLVEKRTNEKDRRRVLLTLSAHGRSVLQALTALQAPVNDALFECLTVAEFDRLRHMIAALVACGERALIRQRDLMGVNALQLVETPSTAHKAAPRKKKPRTS